MLITGGKTEDVTILLIVASCLGMCAQYWIKTPWMYLLTTLMSIGMLVSVLDDYTGEAIPETQAMILVVVAVAVILFSMMNYVMYYFPDKKRR